MEDRPSQADLSGFDGAEADEGEPLGMFIGPTLADDGAEALPPRVMIYRTPHLEACDSETQLAEEIRRTLVHELGHYAGMDEGELEDHGYGPMEGDEGKKFDLDPE